MSSDNTIWSFSITSLVWDSDSSGEDEPQAKNPTQLQERLIKDLDISSREDTVSYQPNPFSIAKINAASRSKNSISLGRNAAGQSGSDTPAPISSQRTLETRRQADIREAFRKQAQKSAHATGTRPRHSETFTSRDISLNSVSAANATSRLSSVLGLTTDSDLISDEAEHVIPFKDAPLTEQRSPVTEPRATMSSIPHMLDPVKPDLNHITQLDSPTPNYGSAPIAKMFPVLQTPSTVSRISLGRGIDTQAKTISSPAHELTPKRLSLKPSFITQKTNGLGRRHRLSSPISGRFAGSTTPNPSTPGSQHVGLSHTNHGLFATLHGNATRGWSRSPSSAPLGAKSAGGPAAANDEYDFASDDTLVASPIRLATSHLPSVAETRVISSTRRTVNEAFRDPDEEWSTLPQRKKLKASAQAVKRDRRTGCFSVNPGLIHGTKKVGVSASSSQRVIKFLPPPLLNDPEYTSSRVNDDRSEQLQITFIEGMDGTTQPSSRVLGHSTDDSENFVEVDTDGIARRYRRSQALKQKVRKLLA